MNFKIPEEYKDFVTDAGDLLHQLNGHNNSNSNSNNNQNDNVNDNVTYYIYKDIKDNSNDNNDSNCTYSSSSSSILAEYIELYNTIITLIQPLMKNYRWNYHSFHLTLRIDSNHHHHQPKQQQQQQQHHPQIFLYGSTSIGQCIDDEWFIVYLLLYISMKLHNINIHVIDSDGEFLLIEVGYYLLVFSFMIYYCSLLCMYCSLLYMYCSLYIVDVTLYLSVVESINIYIIHYHHSSPFTIF